MRGTRQKASITVPTQSSSSNETFARKTGPLIDCIQSEIDGFFVNLQKSNVSEIANVHILILNIMREYYGGSAAVLAFIDEERDFERVYNVGYDKEFTWREKLSFGDGALSRSMQNQDVDVVTDVSTDSCYIEIRNQTKSQISIPLISTLGKTYGGIAIEFDRFIDYNAAYSAFHRIKKPISRLISYVDAIFAKIQTQEIFSFTDTMSSGQGNYDDIVESAFDAVESITADGELALLYRIGGSLVVTNTRHLAESPSRLHIGANRGQGYTAWCAHTGKSHYCKDTENRGKYPYYRNVDELTKSQYTIPLVIRNEVIGVLNIGARMPFAFSSSQRKLLDEIGKHAAYAIFYWRLYRDTALISHEAYSRLGSVEYLRNFLLINIVDEKKEIASQMMDSLREASLLVETASYPFLTRGSDSIMIIPVIKKYLEVRSASSGTYKSVSNIPEDFEHPITESHLKYFLNSVSDWIDINATIQMGPRQIEITQELYDGIQYLVFKWSFFAKEPLLSDVLQCELNNLTSIRSGGPKSQRMALSNISLWKADRILASYGGYLDISGESCTDNEIVLRGTIRQ